MEDICTSIVTIHLISRPHLETEKPGEFFFLFVCLQLVEETPLYTKFNLYLFTLEMGVQFSIFVMPGSRAFRNMCVEIWGDGIGT